MAKATKGAIPAKPGPEVLLKSLTGIKGLDEITGGGLPKGRPTLVCGGTGCGKTLLSMEFLVRGATQFAEPGVFMSFEEKSEELAKNFASLGFDLDDLAARKMLVLDYVHIEKNELDDTGEYDLEGLFIRLAFAIDRSAPSAWCSTPSRPSSRGWTTRTSCARSLDACSAS